MLPILHCHRNSATNLVRVDRIVMYSREEGIDLVKAKTVMRAKDLVVESMKWILPVFQMKSRCFPYLIFQKKLLSRL